MNILAHSYVKYALIMCGVLVLCLFGMMITGNDESFDQKSPLVLIFMFVAPVVIWFMGVRAHRERLGGAMTFKQGLAEGFRISLVYAIVSPFIFFAYYVLVNPEILQYVPEVYQMPEASMATIIAIDMAAQFVTALVFGTIISAIASLVLRKKLAIPLS